MSETDSNLSSPSTIETPQHRRSAFFNVSLTRSPHQESYSKIIHEDEEEIETPSIINSNDNRMNPSAINSENEKEMILAATNLTPMIVSSFVHHQTKSTTA